MHLNFSWDFLFKAAVCCAFGLICAPSQSADLDVFDECILELARTAPSDVPLGDIRKTCEAARETVESDSTGDSTDIHKSALERRLAIEGTTGTVPFALSPHRPNYIISAFNLNGFSEQIFEQEFAENRDFQNPEVKFQVSYKFSIVRNIFNKRGALFFAYTNRSFWQLFDEVDSRPFRETNHEPEVWLAIKNNWNIAGLRNPLINIGLSHQSNGQGGLLSRSWNRAYATFVFEYDNFYFGIKPWYRIPEQKEDDDNPDIEDYLGHFEFQGIYKHNKDSYGIFLRNNLQKENRGAIRLDWSTPVYDKTRAYIQWFYGYGESLIDYDNKVHSIGVGIQLTDWL